MTNSADENARLSEEIQSLRAHVTALENRVATLETRRIPSVPPSSEDQRIESRLGLLWVNRIGAVTLAFGVLFLFKYAIDKQWITIWGRIVLGLLAGGILTGFSEWLRKRDQRVFSQGVYGCGVAVFYISLYFGLDELRGEYQSAAFAVCLLSALFVAFLFLAARWDRNLLLAFNAAWAIISAGLILHHVYPNVFAGFVLVLAIVHFALASRQHTRLRDTSYLVGHACLLVSVVEWLLTWIGRDVAQGDRLNIGSESLSFLFAIYAVIMIALGFAKRRAIDRLLGLLAIGFVVLKLYFYDIWLLDRLYRISAFVALGFLLLAASYLYSRWKDKLDLIWPPKTD